jgi:hypothetical protein
MIRGIHSRVQSSKLLLARASTVILGSEFHGTHNHFLLSDIFGSLQITPSAVHILKFGINRQIHRLSFKYNTHRIENYASNIYSIVAVFVAAGICLPSRCLSTIHTDAQTDGKDL